jgi:hypothetical protein
VICYFGIPRYLFRIALDFFWKWMVSSGVQLRTFYMLELFLTFGKMSESKQWLRNQRATPPIPGLDHAK